eukprot:CAMPEP_0206394600 /NCGR_PEP_ID=MMETSP0294-20121207/21495_1 /ASSEMBLY_ACC=CAM_ASM_000327 /TAXON_ID=39354 /ORGANISM="Heterosigma akashiwo, Strain CCMP2393" /LENGTH=45 /DNA_ID= /DNA_START= /DNA_END= /DNA_ORIENTATION=
MKLSEIMALGNMGVKSLLNFQKKKKNKKKFQAHACHGCQGASLFE